MLQSPRFEEPERGLLAAFVERLGQRRASAQLGIARNTLVRLVKGKAVNRVTIIAARATMAALLSTGESTP